MLHVVRRLTIGMVLIVAASMVLLLSDPPRKSPASNDSTSEGTRRRIVIIQMASQLIMEEGAAGVIDALSDHGYSADRNLAVTRLNAEGDIATANAMAQEVTGGGYDMIVSLSTPCLQAVANANKQRRVPHVFGLVTDPRQSGVGVGQNPLDHPPYMAGVGTMQPVAESIRTAKKCNPKLAKLGVVWNPAEVNSEINTRLARDACREMNIELLEANAENTAAVRQAASSLIARDVDALWIGGDVTVLAAVDVVIRSAKKASVPVFTCIPGNAAKGTLFDLGANYYEVGRSVGNTAARVLSGESIEKIPVESVVPPKLMLNKTSLQGLRATWSFPQDLVDKADVMIDEQGVHDRKPTSKPSQSTRVRQLEILGYVNTLDVEESQRGLLDGLKKGCKPSRNSYHVVS